jgi:hypothetical protein
MGRLLDAADERGRFAEIGLGMTRRVVQRHEHLPATPPMLPDVVLFPPSRSPASRRGSRPAALARFAGVMRRRGCRTVTIGGRSGAGPMQALLDYASYMPHGYCLFWPPWLVALHAGSDALIFIAYSATPHVISAPPGHPLPGPRCALRHPDIRYRGLVALFATFILLCGIALWIGTPGPRSAPKRDPGLVTEVTAATSRC